MDGIKRSRAEAHLPELSSDIVLFHILPRLPAKSVLRFRSVSKHWRSFLTTSVFAQMHLLYVTDDDLKLIVLSRTPYPLPYTFRTIDCERPKDGLTANRPLPFNVGPVRSIVILTSFHGLYDTKTENLKNIAAPSFGNRRTSCLSFTVPKGCIHLWVSTEIPSRMNCANELWTMDGDGDWSKVYSNSVPNLFFLRPDHQPLHLMENGDFLMHACIGTLCLPIRLEDADRGQVSDIYEFGKNGVQ
ncbi:hypothetical protein L2E82_37762 [Cichorium intybus]|uniref:Uncharacterized protein n=1 Tax=Cichorium intybus TaxID=13427 RepID=A0ACB9AF17_CICIN|nr:hypothetical protein L2E82_37762 [Cichorium intybus]